MRSGIEATIRLLFECAVSRSARMLSFLKGIHNVPPDMTEWPLNRPPLDGGDLAL